jgi:hypothetical protein
MTRRAYFYFVLTFVLGIVVGSGGLFLFALRTGNWHPAFSRERVIKALTHDLNLSPPQVSQLEQIMEDTGKQHHALEVQMDRQFDSLREQNRNRIRQILSPEQLAKFNEIVRQHEERRRRGRRP